MNSLKLKLENFFIKIKRVIKKHYFPFLLSLALLLIVLVIYISFPKSTFLQRNVIESVEDKGKQAPEEIETNNISLLFVGDIMTARTVGYGIELGYDPFQYIKDTFQKYDYVVGNLETTIANPYIAVNSGKLFTFNAPIKSIDTIKNSGISIVNLANNHSMDFGPYALRDQLSRLSEKGVVTYGAGNNIQEAFSPAYIVHKDIKIALIGINDIENWIGNAGVNSPGSAFFERSKIEEEIKKAKELSDIVIVTPHWGIEYQLNSSERQKEWGHFFIDSGADIIIGTHPHVIQKSEEYHGKMIYYSLGNFVFDLMCGIPNACDAQILEVNIKDKKIESSKLIDIRINNQGYPQLK